MSIRRKMTIPAIALTVAAIAAVLTTVCAAFSSFVDNSVYTEVDTYADVIQTKLDEMRHESMVAAKAIAGDMQLREAFSSGDRNAMATRVQQLQNELQTDYILLTNASGKALSSSHGSGNEDLSTQNSVQAALRGEIKTVVGQGAFFNLCVDTGYPVYSDSGALIGVVSAGYRLDTDRFVDGMSALTGCDISVFLGDTRIATTVRDELNNRATGLVADGEISRQVLAGEKFSGPLNVVGNKMYAVYLPIDSGEGDVVGMLFAGRYTSTKSHAIRSFILRGILVSAIALAVCIPVMVQRCRSVTAPIANMVQVAKSLAAGDLDVAVIVDSKDEISDLADAFNTMIEHNRAQAAIIARIADGDLRDIVDVRSDKDIVGKALVAMVDRNNDIIMQIMHSADEVAAASEQLVNGSATLANNNSEQAATVDTLNNTVAVISKSTRKNARRSEEATTLAMEIRSQAEEGAQLMDQMTGAVTDISKAFSSVQYVLKTIDDISFQTNILSLNAAVEAARAGEQGKGFGVVADEVRNLAGKCAEAAKNSTAIIDRVKQTVDLGNGLSAETEKSFHKIAEGINQSAALVADITQFTNKQAAELENLTANAAVFGDSLQTTSTLSEESSASAQELSAHASLLREIVSHFTLRESPSAYCEGPVKPDFGHPRQRDKPFDTFERGMVFSKY